MAGTRRIPCFSLRLAATTPSAMWLFLLTVILSLLNPSTLLAVEATDQPASAAKPSAAATQAGIKTPPAGTVIAGKRSLSQSFKQLGQGQGLTLRTVHSQQGLAFSRPRDWQILPSSAIVVRFDHSRSLTPERSSLTVSLNGRMLQSIPLSAQTVAKGQAVVMLPPEAMQDYNTLMFQVDQHYTYKCEDPFSKELWTTIRPDSALKLDYQSRVPRLDLATLPFPLVDDLALGTTNLGFVAPPSLSSDSQTALATVAASLGNAIGWRQAQTRLIAPKSAFATDTNLVLIGTPHENPAIGQLIGRLPLRSSGKGFVGPIKLGSDDGVIQLVNHPKFPARSVLIVSGNSSAGVRKAAQLLASSPTSRLMSGAYTVAQSYEPSRHDLMRAWPGFVTQPGQTALAHLGLDTQTTRGFQSQPLHYILKRMPDLYLSETEKVKLTTHYSYTSQLDPKLSTLEVRLNGKSIGSTRLNQVNGATNATFTVELPAPDFYTFNDLTYQFHLVPEKPEACRFITDTHLWGTVHSTSTVDVPATIQASLPDVGYFNDGGFPFTLAPDLNQVTVVIPDALTPAEADTLLQLMIRLGRITPGEGLTRTSKQPNVVKVSQWRAGSVRKDHLIVIGRRTLSQLNPQFKGKYQLIINGQTANLSDTEQPLTRITHNPAQGVIEEILSPLNHDRVALLLYGETEAGQQEVANTLKSDGAFGKIEPGNLVVINKGQPTSVIALRKGEAKNLTQSGERNFGGPLANLPDWAHWLLIALAAFGLMGLLAFVIRRRSA